jgi:type I restriction enzyme S subunit
MNNKKMTTGTKEDGKSTLVPKLRFPEFREVGEWTTESLGSLARISTEKVGDKSAIPMSITSGVGLVSQMDKFGRIIAGSSYANYLLLKKDDFAYNKSATKEFPEGFIALYTGNESAAVPNSIFTCFRIKGQSLVPQYLNYLFLGNLHGRWLRKFIEVGARAHGSLSINDDDLLAMPVPLPSGKRSVTEQKKIAECLSSVDEVIAAQAQKVDALKAHKKGLMQQLFPREGETQPLLRFPEFRNDGEWACKPFSELYEFKPTNTYSRDQLNYESGPAKNIHYGDIHMKFSTSFRIQENIVPYVNESEDLLKLKSDTYCQEGDMVFADASEDLTDVGKSIELVNLGGEKVFSGSHTILARQKGKAFIVGFAGHLFKGRGVRSQIEKEAQGTKVLQISPGRLAGITVAFPANDAEQQRIADCLSSLDTLIGAETQKLEALKRHKRGLMQQLFPLSEGAEA